MQNINSRKQNVVAKLFGYLFIFFATVQISLNEGKGTWQLSLEILILRDMKML